MESTITSVLRRRSTSRAIDGNSASDFGGGICNFGTATITACTIRRNSAVFGGCGISNLGTVTINTSTISGNSGEGGEAGGGMGNGITGTATIVASTISGNSAKAYGGGINNFGGTMTIVASTISGNSAGDSGGGGIDNVGTVTIVASTISGNSARGDCGGGIHNYTDPNVGPGTMTIVACTISDNSSPLGGGGICNRGNDSQTFGTVTLLTSIVAGNSALVGQGQDGGGDFTSLGHNLIGNSNGSSGWVATDLLNIDPKLGALQYNGGPTKTVGSAAGQPRDRRRGRGTRRDHRSAGRVPAQGRAPDISRPVRVSGSKPASDGREPGAVGRPSSSHDPRRDLQHSDGCYPGRKPVQLSPRLSR